MAGGEELENLAHELERSAGSGREAEELRRAAEVLGREAREPDA
jgi:hypothetical protein